MRFAPTLHPELLLLIAWLPATGVLAESRQDLGTVQRTAEAFVAAQAAGLPGEVSTSVGALDPRLALPTCAKLQAYLPAGARLWGSSSVGVRCLADGGWSVALPVQVKVRGQIVIATRPLLPGQTLAADDLAMRPAELTQMPAGVVTDTAALVGKSLAVGVPAHQPLRHEWVRAPQVIRQGQQVKLIAQGQGFRLTNEGVAVNHALEGQPAQVRLASGQMVRGTARAPGLVEVVF